MKRFEIKSIRFALILIAVLCIVMLCCAFAAPRSFNIANAAEVPQSLKILTVGNSFSVDANEHLYTLLKTAGVGEVKLGVLYVGSCDLAAHKNNAESDNAVYSYFKNVSGEWNLNTQIWPVNGDTSISTALADEEWDWVVLQQASGDSGIESTYNDDIDYLAQYVTARRPQAKLAWHMTWAYQGDSSHTDFAKYDYSQNKMYDMIVNCVENKILTNDVFSAVIPSGTAVQNARTSKIGDRLTLDGYHMSRPMGRTVAALTWATTLTGFDYDAVEQAPTGIGLGEEEWRIAKESAKNACAEPYGITYSQIIDESAYSAFDWGATAGFWNATVGINFAYLSTPENSVGQAYENLTKIFVASKSQLTADDLPLGSYIDIAEGYTLKSVGWDESGIIRENIIHNFSGPARVLVDESWWSNCKTRAFNVFANDNSELYQKVGEVEQAIKVYVPKVEEIEFDPKDYVLFDWKPVERAYWFSTDSKLGAILNTPKNSLLTNFDLYVSSGGMFTRENLPIGTVIEIASGYQYRPEGWLGLTPQNSRESNVSKTRIIVDEEWWGDYVYRAFNISKRDGSSLVGKTEEVKDAFKIYIPKNAVYSAELFYPDAGGVTADPESERQRVLVIMFSVCGALVGAAAVGAVIVTLARKRKGAEK